MTNSLVVVDDEPVILNTLRGELEGQGYTVHSYFNGQSLLSEIDEIEEPFCFVVDYKLPDTNASELIDRLRDLGHWQPFFVISGKGDIPTVVESMRQGAVNFIEKPFDKRALFDTVKKAKDQYGLAKKKQTILERIEKLSKREQDVLREMNHGLDSDGIGSALNISKKTVEVHKTRIFRKLNCDSTSQVVAVTNFKYSE